MKKKKLPFFCCLLFLIVLSKNIFSQPLVSVQKKYTIPEIVESKGTIVNKYNYFISSPTKALVAYQKQDSAWVIIDSAATISALLTEVTRLRELYTKKDSTLDKTINLLSAAENILLCVNTQGYVPNKYRDSFNLYVRKYFKLKGNTTQYDHMQLLDIFIRDKNGKVLGRINQ